MSISIRKYCIYIQYIENHKIIFNLAEKVRLGWKNLAEKEGIKELNIPGLLLQMFTAFLKLECQFRV